MIPRHTNHIKKLFIPALTAFVGWLFVINFATAETPNKVTIPDTGQLKCYNNYRQIDFPDEKSRFYGQDAQYETHPMNYVDNGDGTVTDLVTGLMWSKSVNKIKVSLSQAHKMAERLELGGYTDWRVPNIKELYSLIHFSGNTGNPGRQGGSNAIPYINTDYFDFRFGDTSAGERYIDAQWLSSTQYVTTTMNGAQTLFGVNFADGRIKGYGYSRSNGHGRDKKFFVRFVRGNVYGHNEFIDNRDGTITDNTTGLMWMKTDSKQGMNWQEALAYAESMKLAGYTDWRLPNAKELQYIVDYERSPATTRSPAIDPIFETSSIMNEMGQKDYPYFWTSTTHEDGPQPGNHAVYISFGRGMGKMRGQNMDVHGAGSQRSDPKSGQGNISRGPQGDWVRVQNYVRLVRGGSVVKKTVADAADKSKYPYTLNIENPSALSSVNNSMGNKRPLNQQMNQSGFQQGPPGQGGMGMAGQDQGGNRFINRFDRNGDGKVSSAEFTGPPNHFTMFDKNGDGYISKDEAPTGPPAKNRMGPPNQMN